MSEFRINRQTGEVHRLEGDGFVFFACFSTLGVTPSDDDALIECRATWQEDNVCDFEPDA